MDRDVNNLRLEKIRNGKDVREDWNREGETEKVGWEKLRARSD